jgi:ribonuclease PH
MTDQKKQFINRQDGRTFQELRTLRVSYNVFGYAPGSVLFEIGNTKVLCAVSIQNGVPTFLRGKGSGWLTAEYAMLPTATTIRTTRDSSQAQRNGRSVEISRLIGRAMRSIIKLDDIGERTITIDCDVLQADGGTRTASINGAFLALHAAQELWLEQRIIARPIIDDVIGAISVGVLQDNVVVVDPNFYEDSSGLADFNFILTRSDKVIEIQGGVEKKPISFNVFNDVHSYAQKGILDIFDFFDKHLTKSKTSEIVQDVSKQKAPFFSLKNRQLLAE